MNNVLILIKLLNVRSNQFIDVIFDSFNFVGKLSRLGIQFSVFCFLLLVFFLECTNLDLIVSFFVHKSIVFIFKLGELSVQTFYNFILFGVELIKNLRMLVLLVFIVWQFGLVVILLTFDISMCVFIVLFEHFVSSYK